MPKLIISVLLLFVGQTLDVWTQGDKFPSPVRIGSGLAVRNGTLELSGTDTSRRCELAVLGWQIPPPPEKTLGIEEPLVILICLDKETE